MSYGSGTRGEALSSNYNDAIHQSTSAAALYAQQLQVLQQAAQQAAYNPVTVPVSSPYYIPTTSIPQGVPLGSTVQESLQNAQLAAMSVSGAATLPIIQQLTTNNQAIENAVRSIASTVAASHQDTQAIVDAVHQAITGTIDSGTRTNQEAINQTLSQAFNSINAQIQQNQQLINASHDEVTNAITAQTNNNAHNIGLVRDTIAQSIGETARIVSSLTDTVHQDIQSQIRSQIDSYGEQTRSLQQAIIDEGNTTAHAIQTAIEENRTAQSTVFDQITQAIQDLIKPFFDNFEKMLADVGTQVTYKVSENIDPTKEHSPSAWDRFNEIFSNIRNDKYHSIEELIVDFTAVPLNTEFFKIALALYTLVTAWARLFNIIQEPYFAKIAQLSNSSFPSNLLPPEMYIQGARWNDKVNRVAADKLQKAGYDEVERILLGNKVSYQLDPLDYMRNILWFNGNRDILKSNLTHRGLNEPDIDILIYNYLNGLPQYNDLIRFMVRDTFSADADRLGLFDEFPDKIMEFWHGQPIGDQWAKHYWGAHWQPISPQQAYTMLHYGRRSMEDVKLFLKQADYAPPIREDLIAIAYNPVGRVDARRLFKMGLWTEEDVYQNQLKLGTTPKDSRTIAQWVTLTETEDDNEPNKKSRDLIRVITQKQYQRDLIDDATALTALINTGMNHVEASEYVTLWQLDKVSGDLYNRTQSNKTKMVTTIKDSYLNRRIDRNYAHNTLIALGLSEADTQAELGYLDLQADLKLKQKKIDNVKSLYSRYRITREEAAQHLKDYGSSPTEIDYLLQNFDLDRELKEKRPTDAQLAKWYKSGVINGERYVNELRANGWPDEYINLIGEQTLIELGA